LPTESAARPRWDLQPGRPDVSSFPRDAWLSATRRVLATSPPDVLGYSDSRGLPELRRALADYLGRVRGVVATSEQIIVCAGYSQALAMLSSVLTARRQRSLAFENPSFDFHRAIAGRAGLDTPGVPVDRNGIVVDEIPGRAVVVTPAHQFPLGMTLAPGRRSALADWAHRRNGLVLEDDYDGEFRYDRQPVGAMQGLAPDRVIYAGTASKTLAPGLRISWLAVPPDLTEAVAASKGYPDAHPSTLDQLVLADLLDSGAYDRHVRQCRTRYGARRNRLVAVLAVTAPGVRVVGTAAGLQAVLELPTDGPSEDELVARANRLGLALQGLAPYWLGSGPHPPGLVVGYATPPEHAFEPTLAVLADVLT
jgi:GntR family transcriptional regulator/MocR family aminotransferase